MSGIDNDSDDELHDNATAGARKEAQGKSSRGGTGTLSPSPPIKKECVPQRELLPVFAKQNLEQEAGVDFSILDIVS